VAPSSTGSVNYLPFVFLVAYMIAAGLALRYWIRRSQQQRPPAIDADPGEWLSSWFSKLLTAELYIIVGAVGTCLLTYFISGMAYSAEAPFAELGFGIGFFFIALFVPVLDAVLVARVRATSRRGRQLPEEPTSSPQE
jgi:hypothetical protein